MILETSLLRSLMEDIFLAVDTSTTDTFVSVKVAEGQRLVSVSCSTKESHNEELASLVESALRESGVSASDITHVIYGLGPGSFTGLRIGLSFIKGLISAAQNIASLVTVPSLHAASFAAHQKTSQRFCGAVADARREEVFCVLFDTFTMTEVVPLGIEAPKKFVELAHGFDSRPSIMDCAGSLLPSVETIPLCSLSDAVISLYETHPQVFNVVEPTAFALSAIEPLYLREVAAKTILERKGAPNNAS